MILFTINLYFLTMFPVRQLLILNLLIQKSVIAMVSRFQNYYVNMSQGNIVLQKLASTIILYY